MCGVCKWISEAKSILSRLPFSAKQPAREIQTLAVQNRQHNNEELIRDIWKRPTTSRYQTEIQWNGPARTWAGVPTAVDHCHLNGCRVFNNFLLSWCSPKLHPQNFWIIYIYIFIFHHVSSYFWNLLGVRLTPRFHLFHQLYLYDRAAHVSNSSWRCQGAAIVAALTTLSTVLPSNSCNILWSYLTGSYVNQATSLPETTKTFQLAALEFSGLPNGPLAGTLEPKN